MERNKRLSTLDAAKVMAWVNTNILTTLDQSLNDRCRAVKAETGISCPAPRLSEIEQACGVTRVKGGGHGSKKDRIKIVAEHLIALMTQMGLPIPDDLLDVRRGR